MIDALALLLSIAAGRSQNPDEGGGVGVILGLAALVVVVIGVAWFLVGRVAGRRRGVRDPGT